MDRSELKVGQRIRFGRVQGQKTLGVIVKLNPSKAKVRTLEERGVVRDHRVGGEWTVPYSLIYAVDENDALVGSASPTIMRPQTMPPVEVKYMPHRPVDNLIMQAIMFVYVRMSPENLSCDGEASRAQIKQQSAVLSRQLRGLTMAIGYHVSEEQAYAWDRQRTEYEKANKPRPGAFNGALSSAMEN